MKGASARACASMQESKGRGRTGVSEVEVKDCPVADPSVTRELEIILKARVTVVAPVRQGGRIGRRLDRRRRRDQSRLDRGRSCDRCRQTDATLEGSLGQRRPLDGHGLR
jgi:hypothetical protein